MNPETNDKLAAPLQLSLLGRPQLLWQGMPQTTLLVKAQALLFFLALEPQPHTRTALATLLWSDMSDEKALAESHDDLATAARNVPERHRSLQMAFEYSWRLLTEDEQAVLLGLAVFRGGFTWAAAETVAVATRRLLANLVGKSLVQRGRNGRYDMHEQLRQFTLQKNDSANQNQTRLNHAAHFAAFLQQRETAIKTSGQQEAIKAIKADIENIRAAWETAVTEQSSQFLQQMAGTLFHFYMKQGLQREGARVFGAAAAMLGGDGRADSNEQRQPLLGRLLICQGRCSEFISQNFDVPRQALTQGLIIARQWRQDEDIALALLGLGQLSIASGDRPS